MPVINIASARVIALLLILFSLSTNDSVAQDGRALVDRMAIGDQLAQYSYRWDSKNSAGFADLFTEDGIMERRVGGEVTFGSRVEGRQAILDYATTSHQGRLADRQTRHHMSALVILQLSSESAVTENMALITHQTENDRAPVIRSSGIYRISWRKTEDGWKIAERILFTDRFVSR